MFKTSETTAKLDAALAKAQGEFTNPEKNRTVKVKMKTGGEYTFEYATFDSIIDMARPILAKHGITVSQFPSTSYDGNGMTMVTVATRVAHDGEWMVSEITGPCDGHNMQAIGSGVSYLSRYSYCNVLTIASEYDDDGAAASGNESAPTSGRVYPPCPKCQNAKAVIKGKEEFGGGWVCYKAKGGCGEKWQDAPAEQPPAGEKPVNTKRKMADEAQTMSPEELKEYTDLINAYGSRIDQAVSAGDKDAMAAIASDLKNEHERVKGVMRPKYSAGLKVMAGNHLPEGERKPEPAEEQAL